MVLKKPKVAFPDLTSEAALGFFSSQIVIGVDEVGRGCLAGPVVAAAALLCGDKIKALGFKNRGVRPESATDSSLFFRVRDSKLVPEEERETLAGFLRGFVNSHSVALASVQEIEEINIYHASHLAMERAVSALEESIGRKADKILIDGNKVPRSLIDRGIPIVKGDQKSLSIASASLLAKVHRDQMMREFDQHYPGYHFGQHKGYGTELHLRQIRALGATPIHRKDFRGVSPD
jgi:ribonuclease HII